MDILLFGKQGCGKGTQADFILQNLGYTLFAMSGELKKVIASGSELGQKIKTIIDAGNLVPDDIIIEIVENFLVNLSDPSSAILFDGFPRTEAQRAKLEEVFAKLNRQSLGLLIEISDAEATQRMLSRRICSKCSSPVAPDYSAETCPKCQAPLTRRSDDNPEAIAKRLSLYSQETKPVIDWYQSQNRLITVDGTLPISEVSQTIQAQLQNHV